MSGAAAESGAATVVPPISIAAFAVTAQGGAALRSAVDDRRMARARSEVIDGDIEAAIARYGEAPSPDLIILEAGEDIPAFLARLEALAEVCLPVTRVITLGPVNDVTLYRDLTGRGVSDYLVMPLDVLDLVAAIARTFPEGPEARRGRIVSFIAARGGSGASILAQNCAHQIATRLGAATILADLDWAFGTAALGFNLDPAQQGLGEAVRNVDRLDHVLLDRLAAQPHPNLRVLGNQDAAGLGQATVAAALPQLADTLQTAADVTILDLPHGWSGWLREALGMSDEIVLTAVPDLSSLRNAKTIVEHLRAARPNDPPPRLVLNQVGARGTAPIAEAKFAEALDLSVIARLPFDARRFGAAANEGVTLDKAGLDKRSLAALAELGCLVSGRREKPRGGGLGALAARLRGRQPA